MSSYYDYNYYRPTRPEVLQQTDDGHIVIPTPTPELERKEKNIFSINYPEFKGSICVTGWTWIPCPTWKNPSRKCKQDIQMPCVKKRTSNYRIYAYVTYPKNFETAVKNELIICNATAVVAAYEVIYGAVALASAGTPAAQAAAAVGALPAAAQAYFTSFATCLANMTLADALKRQVQYDIVDETKKLNDWH